MGDEAINNTPVVQTHPWEKWSVWAAAVPAVAVAFAFGVAALMYRLTFQCNAVTGDDCSGPAEAIKDAIGQLPASDTTTIRAALDVATRFTWQPAMTVFAVAAGIITCAMIYTALRALESWNASAQWAFFGATKRRQLGLGILLILVVGVPFALVYLLPVHNLTHRDLLLPFLSWAFGDESGPVSIAGRTQRVFRAAAFTGAFFTVAAAAAAMMPPPRRTERDDKATAHLSNQWRRLTTALYCGAILLVSALFAQTAFFAWPQALASAAAEQTDIQLRTKHNELELLRGELAALPAAASAGKPSLERKAIDDKMRAMKRDSANIAEGVRGTSTMARRVSLVTDAAVARGGGIIFSLLLAVMYIPAAMILLERAREISVGVNEEERRAWRVKHGIAFTVSTQWVKALAVLAPTIASTPAIQYVLKLFE